jgi:hypothetical protein
MRKCSGQFSSGPKSLAAQSNARIRRAISLSPGKIERRSPGVWSLTAKLSVLEDLPTDAG